MKDKLLITQSPRSGNWFYQFSLKDDVYSGGADKEWDRTLYYGEVFYTKESALEAAQEHIDRLQTVRLCTIWRKSFLGLEINAHTLKTIVTSLSLVVILFSYFTWDKQNIEERNRQEAQWERAHPNDDPPQEEDDRSEHEYW